MDAAKIAEVLAAVEFRDWKFLQGQMGDGSFIQASWQGEDSDTGQPCLLKGRKWYISPFSVDDEVVKTCWLAVELALRHEAMEEFHFCGRAPFHPHNDVFKLLDVQKVYRNDIVPEPIEEEVTG